MAGGAKGQSYVSLDFRVWLWVPAIRVPGAGAGLMHLSDFIAGKPAPTGLMQLLWRLAAGDSGAGGWSDSAQRFHRGQARSHRFDAAVVGGWLQAIRVPGLV